MGQAIRTDEVRRTGPVWPDAYRLKRGEGRLYNGGMIMRILTAITLFFVALTTPAAAQDREVPYWATITTDELNMRVGPSMQYRIDWVYRRKGLPMKVIRVVDRWRLVEGSDGTQGWVSSQFLSLARGAVVVGEDLAPMRDTPADNGALKWNAQPGVVGKLGKCSAGWCEFDVGGRVGWIADSRIWGAGKP